MDKFAPQYDPRNPVMGMPLTSTAKTDEIEVDCSYWPEDHIEALPVARDAIQDLLEGRTC